MQKIGLEGVFKTEAFSSGLSKYLGGLATAGTRTVAVAGSIASALGTAVVAGAAIFAAVGVAAVAASVAVGGAITRMVFDAAKLGDAYSAMSGVTGISTDRLQELQYAGKLLDVDLETITSGLRLLTRNMYMAREGTGEQSEAFDQLGIKVTDAAGNLRDSDIVFGETIDALGKIKNETLRDALAMKIMGRSAMELNPLIKAGSGLLAEYSAEARAMGAVVEGSGIEALDIFQDRMDALKLSSKGILATMALNFLPFFDDIQDSVRSMVKDFVATGDVNKLGTNISKMFTGIIKTLNKSMPQIIKSVSKFLVSMNKVLIANLPMFIKSGGQLLTSILKGLAENIPELLSTGMGVIETIYNSIMAAMPSIMSAGGNVIKTLGDGIRSALTGLPSIQEILAFIFKSGADLATKFKEWVATINWSKLSQGVADAIAELDWSGYGAQFSVFLNNLVDGIEEILKETKWGVVFKSIGTAIGDFIAGAIKPGETWATVWKTQWGPTLDLLKKMIIDYGWYDVGVAIMKQILIGMLAIVPLVMNAFGVFKNIPGTKVQGANPLPGTPGGPAYVPAAPGSSPYLGATDAYGNPYVPKAPSIPTPGGGRGMSSVIQPASSSKNVTNNVTVNNPTPEPASTSVSKTLKNLSYLGA